VLARIEAVGVHRPSGYVYADVAYWPGPAVIGPPMLRNDFLIEAIASANVPHTDTAGRYLTQSGRTVLPVIEVDGEWVPRPEDPADPWRRELVRLDQAEQLLSAVAAYAERSPVPGDHRSVPASQVSAIGLTAELAALSGLVITID
jgi:hypothetical protein